MLTQQTETYRRVCKAENDWINVQGCTVPVPKHTNTLLLLGYTASDIPACCLMAVGYFFFIKQLKLITTTRIQNHYQLFHRTTLLAEALRYTRVEFTAGCLLMVLRHVRTCFVISQTHRTCDFLSLIRQNQHCDMTTFTNTLAVKCGFRHAWTEESQLISTFQTLCD